MAENPAGERRDGGLTYLVARIHERRRRRRQLSVCKRERVDPNTRVDRFLRDKKHPAVLGAVCVYRSAFLSLPTGFLSLEKSIPHLSARRTPHP